MKQCLKTNWKRYTSGFLAFLMASTLVVSDATVAHAAQSMDRFAQDGEFLIEEEDLQKAALKKASFKNHKEDQLGLRVFADEDSRYYAGGQMYLDVHMKNESGQILTGGTLTYKAKGIDEELAGFELDEDDLSCLDENLQADEDETEAAEESAEEETPEETEAQAADETESSQAENETQTESGDENETEAGDDDPEAESESESAESEADEDELLKKVEGITLAPGQIFTARFVCTIDEDIEKAKEQKIEFQFKAQDENEEKVERKETFYYTVNHLNIDAVKFQDGNRVKTGEEVIMGIHSSMFSDDTIMKDSEIEELLASASNALATDSNASKATDSNGNESAEDDFVVDMENTTYDIQMYNAKLNNFKVRKILNDDIYDNLLICTFRVSKDVEPGVYFGKITQKSKMNGRTYRSTQGFSLIVTGDGEITLEGKVGKSEVVITGPADSFPDADQLSVRVAEVSAEQQAQVDEALAKKAEEGIQINQYKALDIKIYADGEEVEPTGPIQVAFKNLGLKKETPVQKVRMTAARAMNFLTGDTDDTSDAADGTGTENGATGAAEGSGAADPAVDGTDEAAEETTSEIRVFHLDEIEATANEMISSVEEDGTVLMDTDHFSVYIVVDMDQLGGSINLTVQHWTKISALSNADETDGLKESAPADGKPGNATASLPRVTQFTKIYSDDLLKLDNNLKKTVEELSKICISNSQKEIKNYTLSQIWVLKNGKNSSSTSEADWVIYKVADYQNSKKEIVLDKNAVVRMVYDPVKTDGAKVKWPVTFYDYNISDGKRYNSNGVATSNGMYLKTNQKGINTPNNYTGGTASNRIAVGQSGLALYHPSADATKNGLLINRGNGATASSVPNMVKDVNSASNLKNGPAYNGLYDAGLFNNTPKTGKVVTDEYELGFNQIGDTYTLSKVWKGNSKALEDLEYFEEIYDNGTKHIFSNSFWPLDSFEYTGRDPLLGDKNKVFSGTYNSAGNFNTLANSDDNIGHNWFFGMRYEFTFQLGDYTGPLKYYFRGDDDFWLYVDGKLKTDIGGIHSSIGKTVDLEYLKNEPKDKDHVITIFYAERGGYGSSCYMEFTLPNVKPVDFDTSVPKTDVVVTKKWEDFNNPYRPDVLLVQLHYKETTSGTFKKYGDPVAMTGTGNTWTYKWSGLPKDGYQYKVTEVVPDGYKEQYSNAGGICTFDGTKWVITITNSMEPEVQVLVEKVWDDENNQDGNRPDNVTMQLLWRTEGASKWETFAGAQGLLTLDGKVDSGVGPNGNGEYSSWKGRFTVPGKMLVDGKVVGLEYTVRELNGKTQISNNGSLPGKYVNTLGNYKVTYAETINKPNVNDKDGTIRSKVIVTNSYTPKTIDVSVVKEWKNVPQHMTPTVTVALYKKLKTEPDTAYVKVQGSDKTLTKPSVPVNNIYAVTEKWSNLSKYSAGKEISYIVYELRPDGSPITADENRITLSDGYEYKVSIDTSDPTNVKLTNEMISAKLLVQKVVLNEDGLPHEPIDQEYKFLIRVTGDDNFDSTLALGNGDKPETIYVVPPADGNTFTINEIVPMEYEIQSIVSQTQGLDATSWDGVGKVQLSNQNATVKVKPGEQVLVTVTNKPSHSGYFHHTASVTNENKNPGTGNFNQANDFSEVHGKNTNGKSANQNKTTGNSARQMIAAALESQSKSKREDDELLERGDEIFG